MHQGGSGSQERALQVFTLMETSKGHQAALLGDF